MLNQFLAYRNGFNGNIAMLLSYGASGGIAYVNTLCNSNPDYRMGFSSIGSTYSTVPTYSWSVEVVTHEFGHLLGSQHTHACVWNGNNTAIDGCYTTEGGCANPGIPSGGGTIMSYCHLTSTGSTLPKASAPSQAISSGAKQSCGYLFISLPGSPTPSCTDGIQNGQETGVDCGGPSCPPCPTGCTTNSGTLTIVLDNYPSRNNMEHQNASGVILYSGGPYSAVGGTVTVPLCLPMHAIHLISSIPMVMASAVPMEMVHTTLWSMAAVWHQVANLLLHRPNHFASTRQWLKLYWWH